VFCELGPKKISFLGDQPTKKKEESKRKATEINHSIGPAQFFQILIFPSLSLNHFSSRQQ